MDSPVVPDPPSSQRRRQVVDLPGVAIPPKNSASPSISASTPEQRPLAPQSTRCMPNVDSIAESGPSLATTSRNTPLVAMASISSQPNIQPPRLINKENSPSTTTQRDTSPNCNWKEMSPMRTILRAVHLSKKQGRKASMDKMDKIMDRNVMIRMSSEFEPEPDASASALLHQVKVMEKQNTKLAEKNEMLSEKCKKFTSENEGLQRFVRPRCDGVRTAGPSRTKKTGIGHYVFDERSKISSRVLFVSI